MRKQVPSDKTKAVVEFSTKRPRERFASIKDGLGVRALNLSVISPINSWAIHRFSRTVSQNTYGYVHAVRSAING